MLSKGTPLRRRLDKFLQVLAELKVACERMADALASVHALSQRYPWSEQPSLRGCNCGLTAPVLVCVGCLGPTLEPDATVDCGLHRVFHAFPLLIDSQGKDVCTYRSEAPAYAQQFPKDFQQIRGQLYKQRPSSGDQA